MPDESVPSVPAAVDPRGSAGAIPVATLLRYGIGQVGAQIYRDVPATLLPLFFTTMLGVPAWLGGIAILIPKLWIVVCDPLVGVFSDRQKPVWGRLPFLLVGGGATSLSLLVLFIPPVLAEPWLNAVYVGLVFLLGSTAFSIFSVPYLAIASEMSSRYHERTKIMTYRMIFTSVGLIIGVGLAQPLVVWFGGGRQGWAMMAICLAILCAVSMIGCALGLRGVPLNPAEGEALPLGTQFRIAARNRPFIVLVSAHFVQQLGQAASYSAIALMFIYIIQDVALILPFIVVMSVTCLLVQPVWLNVSRMLGKRTTYALCVIGWSLLTLTWYQAGPSADVLAAIPGFGTMSTQQALVLLRAFGIGVLNSGFILMSLSMLTDAIEFDRRRYRASREGIYSGVYSAVEKFAFAAGPAIGGIVLSLAGFKSSTEGAVAQGPEAVQGILLVFGLLPAGFAALALAIMSGFRLTELELSRTQPIAAE